MTFRLLFVLSAKALLFSALIAKEANWARHEIFSGSHVNSATAHDYDKAVSYTHLTLPTNSLV